MCIRVRGIGESGIAVGGHAVGSGVALGSQNIVVLKLKINMR